MARYEEFLRDIIISVHANIRELNERKIFADPEDHTHIEAKLLAYREILSILRSSADDFDIPAKDIGL